MSAKLITLVLIDDHPVVRAGYRYFLESTKEIMVLAEAGDGETGCVLYHEYQPDMVIIDINMPGIGGLETIHRIKSKNPAANILALSMHSSEIMVKRVLDMGATGYLTKQCTPEQLLEAVNRISQGKPYIDAKLASNMLNDGMQGDGDKHPLHILSQREFQIFTLLAEGNSVLQIAEIISISPKTVGVHHASIMRKLGLQNTVQLVRLAIDCGLIRV
ncbi:MAG: response regulator transcription factor [Nitrosomonas sp.]